MVLGPCELGCSLTGWTCSLAFKVSPWYAEVRTENDKDSKVEGAAAAAAAGRW